MKPFITLLACLICMQLCACSKGNEAVEAINTGSNSDSMKLKITVGTKTFHATFYNNATAKAFKERLPLTINMKELNGNEKFFDLPNSLPANATNPGTIRSGDLMLYGSNTLVLFYTSFSTSYSYTPLARIDDASGLAAALGSGNINITFEPDR